MVVGLGLGLGLGLGRMVLPFVVGQQSVRQQHVLHGVGDVGHLGAEGVQAAPAWVQARLVLSEPVQRGSLVRKMLQRLQLTRRWRNHTPCPRVVRADLRLLYGLQQETAVPLGRPASGFGGPH